MADNNTSGTGRNNNNTDRETEEQRKKREGQGGNEKPSHQSDKPGQESEDQEA
ncbi:MAG: hypothetical protein V4481_03430 [Patescibacteria group bacterium]